MFTILDGRTEFYQWDKNRKLIVEDSTIKEVHFCNKTDDCSLVCETYVEDGKTLVDVPNELLQSDWRINVYAYDGSATKHCAIFKVNGRTKPADYLYTETEILNYDNVLQIANDAKELAKRAGVTATSLGGFVNIEDAITQPIEGLRIYGRTVQYGTPTPAAPVALTNADNPTITICQQNLLRNREVGETHTKNGVSYTHYEDRVTFSGVSSKDTWETINYLYLPAGTYVLGQTRGGDAPLGKASFIALIYKTDEVNTDFSANAADSTDTFTLTETRKIRFCINVKKGTAVDGYIIPHIRNTAYKYSGKFEPYDGNTFAFTRELRGLEYKYTQHTPIYTDTNGKKWYCDEIDFERGVYIQRVKAVTLDTSKGTIKTGTYNGKPYKSITFRFEDEYYNFTNSAICDRAVYGTNKRTWGEFTHNASYKTYDFYGDANSTYEDFVKAYNGATLYYPIEPIEIPLTHNELEAFSNMRMEKDFTNMYINRETEFAVDYMADTAKYIDVRIQKLTDAIISLGGNI